MIKSLRTLLTNIAADLIMTQTQLVGKSCTSSSRTEYQSSLPVPPNLKELQYSTSKVQPPLLCPGTICVYAAQPRLVQLMRSWSPAVQRLLKEDSLLGSWLRGRSSGSVELAA